jgi:alpha-1,2-mannosyltransferase
MINADPPTMKLKPLSAPVKFALALALFLLSFIQTLKVIPGLLNTQSVTDFDVYYFAAQNYAAQMDPYSDLGLGISFILYPPSALIFFLPLSFFPLVTARFIWLMLSYLCFWATIYFLFKLAQPKPLISSYLFLTAFLMQTFSFKFNLGMGQANLMMFLLFVLGIYFASKRRDLLAGIFLALSAALKLIPIFILPFLLLKRRFTLASYFSCFFLIFQFPFFNLAMTYLFNLSNLNSFSDTGADVYNHSLTGMLSRFWGVSPINGYLVLALAALLCFLILKLAQSKKQFVYDGATFACLAFLPVFIFARSPVYQHYLIYLFPFLLILWQKKRPLFFFFWLLLQFHPDPQTALVFRYPPLMSIGAYTYLLLVLALFYLYRFQKKPT